ncbi:DUF4440 domain-containing protein [Erythrobacter sp. HL-111]|uniref:DUF4440 domain-containing protein n=1 Tax=Erythrobacter sp. HL-111 TaxID=1798193 RepID=UPI0006DA41B1|nr:DUF4440 domain-containing protein [Erythrobacter sp. HL-111]KPP90263.1 MAG: SnoaL-like domain [Erythrobacteraceae bacterium HL-111]SDR86246.1 protein of unknown function [Erythrobacter sp. HL-111]
MADVTPEFEALEIALMRAWMEADRRALKSHLAADCVLMFGTAPPVLLDRASFLAAGRGFALTGFRLREVTARRHGGNVWFTGHAELELALGRGSWSGGFLLTDLWRRGRIGRRWKLAERSLAPVEADRTFSDAIRALQLWR